MPRRNKDMSVGYGGDAELPLPGEQIQLTPHELEEYVKCVNDPIYFIRGYVKIMNVDKGIIKFDLWPFQETIIDTLNDNRFVICKLARQSGKSTVVVAGYFLWYILFHPDVAVGILANKEATAIELLSRFKDSFRLLPRFLKQGVTQWDKTQVKFGNNARVVAAATSTSAVRGQTFNIIFLDEFAFVQPNMALDFMSSVYPTISSGKTTKFFIVSTPNGYNLFKKIWTDAIEGKNKFIAIGFNWRARPDRDEAWAAQERANMTEQQFQQEYECDFLGSANSLIAPFALKMLKTNEPRDIRDNGNFRIYEEPKYSSDEGPGHVYIVSVDVGEGQERDYSVCQVVDVTYTPWRQVAIYRNNKIKPTEFATVCKDVARYYCQAFLFFEINGEGLSVSEIVKDEYEYDNILYITPDPKRGQKLSNGGSKKTRNGLKFNVTSKANGCTGLKSLIEKNKLIVIDHDTISELSTFIAKMNQNETRAKTYEAEVGFHDDTVMPLVMLGWLTLQLGFEDYVGISMRAALAQENPTITFDEQPLGILGDLARPVSLGNFGPYEVIEDIDFWRDS